MALDFVETDQASACAVSAFCSPNSLGGGSGIAGRGCAPQGSLAGNHLVTVSMNVSEVGKIYAMIELVPGVRAWVAGPLQFGFRVPAPGNPAIDWVRTDVCHVLANCTSVETLASDTAAVNLGISDQDYITKVVQLAAPAVPPLAGDRLALLLSFTNNAASIQSFGWMPDQPVRLLSFVPDRVGPEILLGKKKRPQREELEEAAAVVAALLLGDDVP
jgi:hypothetical protein